ncbi:MAG: endonuclease III [Deltaproteobacteria bacterium]|nr:endonuclease III [Deltaproteobacteria bacterium]
MYLSDKAQKVLDILGKEYPDAKIALNFKTPLELLIATILSAQCTDERVNKTTPALFKRYKKAQDYADTDIKELEGYISSINFLRKKAKNIKSCCKKIADEFGGKIPDTLEQLIALPGIGRKTANIVLANAFGKDAIAVDTHVKRVANRIGLASSQDPDRIEEGLCRIILKKRWTKATNLFILHGRTICTAKNPQHEICKARNYCDYYASIKPQTTSKNS